MSEIIIPIPARLKNVAKNGHVAGAEDIIDDALNKEQSTINQETLSRLDTVQQKVDDIGDSIQFDEDGDLVTEDGGDFSDDTNRGKIPTIGAIKDGADDEPTAGSDNLVKSGGVASVVNAIDYKIATDELITSGETTYEQSYPIIATVNTNDANKLRFKIKLHSSQQILFLSATYYEDGQQQYYTIMGNPPQDEYFEFDLPQFNESTRLYCQLSSSGILAYELYYRCLISDINKEINRNSVAISTLGQFVNDNLTDSVISDRTTEQGTLYPILNVVQGGDNITYKINYNTEHLAEELSVRYDDNGTTKYLTLINNPERNKDLYFSIPVDNDNCTLYLKLSEVESVTYKLTKLCKINDISLDIDNNLADSVISTNTIDSYDKWPIIDVIQSGKTIYYKFRYYSDYIADALSVRYSENGETKYITLFEHPERNKDLVFSIPFENKSCTLYLTLPLIEPVTYTLTQLSKFNSIYKNVENIDRIINKDTNVPSEYKILVLGDSYSELKSWVNGMIEWLPANCSVVNLGVTSCTVKDKYQDRTTYPYTSRPVSSQNEGNLNTMACQVEKLKRLMAGTDLDEGETQIYTSPSEYPNIIILEGGMNDLPDDDNVEDTYIQQYVKEVNNVYYKGASSSSASFGTTYIKTPISEVNRTCFAGSYRYIVEELLTLFPKAQIFITTVSNMGYWYYDIESVRTKEARQQRKCADILSFTCIDWKAEGQINTIKNFPSGSGTEQDPYIYNAETLQTIDLMHPKQNAAKRYGRLAALVIKQRYMEIETM